MYTLELTKLKVKQNSKSRGQNVLVEGEAIKHPDLVI
jgi:hypothetical protein